MFGSAAGPKPGVRVSPAPGDDRGHDGVQHAGHCAPPVRVPRALLATPRLAFAGSAGARVEAGLATPCLAFPLNAGAAFAAGATFAALRVAGAALAALRVAGVAFVALAVPLLMRSQCAVIMAR